jgi:hypothetical protein
MPGMMMPGNEKIWVVAADMGYGHLRAAYPFAAVAQEKIMSIGVDEYTPPRVKRQWSRMQGAYEFISRNKNLPFIGKCLFSLMDHLLKIPAYYPEKDLSQPTVQVNMLEKYIKDGLYDGMIAKISSRRLPLLTTFYAPAIAAHYYGYDDIYCVVTDTDVNRVWVTSRPAESSIRYFVPSRVAYGRLRQYGVPESMICYSGFPMSNDLIGGEQAEVLKQTVAKRLQLLDPKSEFKKNFGDCVCRKLGFDYSKTVVDRVLTITYAVGGAGAQKELAAKILAGLTQALAQNKVTLNLVAGVRKEVYLYFSELIQRYKAANVHVLYASTKEEYFRQFDNLILNTDILWTKPSELSFYAGLGLPIILSPSIGAQEIANRRWLRDDIGAGIVQRKPSYCYQWLADYLASGKLAEAAWMGYIKIEKMGLFKILDVIQNSKKWTYGPC